MVLGWVEDQARIENEQLRTQGISVPCTEKMQEEEALAGPAPILPEEPSMKKGGFCHFFHCVFTGKFSTAAALLLSALSHL